MKKIGIITHYYGSTNYGGLLQAYALCKKLNDLGYYAEQIQYLHEENVKLNHTGKKYILKRAINGITFRFLRVLNKSFYRNIQLRNTALRKFRDSIQHSAKIYTINNIELANNEYDIFITGSDQVWNTDWYDDAYFLKFVSDKPKYSYAASLGKSCLNDMEKKLIKSNLKDFRRISVREFDSVQLLSDLVDSKIEYCIDPTLLLTYNEWDKITSSRIINDDYIFCYFLGEDSIERNLAKEYAKELGIKIVTLPNLNGKMRKCDKNFGDIKLYDISPIDFISLIKYSRYVFTDSFHACVFSNIYKKEFYVFKRSEYNDMSNRIKSLLMLFNNYERFCDVKEKQNLDYINSIKKDAYLNDNYLIELERSLDFLRKL